LIAGSCHPTISPAHYQQTGAESRLYSSASQHERKKGQSLHSSVLLHSMRYCFPDRFRTSLSAMATRQGGVFDLQPCLLSQLMQNPRSGFMALPPFRQWEFTPPDPLCQAWPEPARRPVSGSVDGVPWDWTPTHAARESRMDLLLHPDG
jgi:hypothetical protein